MSWEDDILSQFINALREEDPERADFNNWVLRHRKNMLFACRVSLKVDENNEFIVNSGMVFPETPVSQHLHPHLVQSCEYFREELDSLFNDIIARALHLYALEMKDEEEEEND